MRIGQQSISTERLYLTELITGPRQRPERVEALYRHLREAFFYVMLTIELVTMIVEKSDMPMPQESYIFRLTFALAAGVVLLSRYSRTGWLAGGGILCFTLVCYLLTGNNDLLRYAMFFLACREMDMRWALRYSFCVTAAGFLTIGILSVTGIYGTFSITADYGREVGVETRTVLGFGHPNTLHGAYYALLLFFLYMYESSQRERNHYQDAIVYGLAFLSNILLYQLTDSRTATALGCVTILVMILLSVERWLRVRRFAYYFGILVLMGCIGLSVWSAAVSELTNTVGGIYRRISDILNGRVLILYYDSKAHKGSLGTWTLFGIGADHDYFFDMGWVRLFYWYGIIPALLIVAFVVYLIILSHKQGNYAALVVFVSMSLYTVIEAAFVSRYIGRLFPLLIAARLVYHQAEMQQRTERVP
ncbi:MAG: hypothetical protein IJT34_11665 [Butyrivibrio sp.]|nr:hypothetical protein [Butyrivibrio sp.]